MVTPVPRLGDLLQRVVKHFLKLFLKQPFEKKMFDIQAISFCYLVKILEYWNIEKIGKIRIYHLELEKPSGYFC